MRLISVLLFPMLIAGRADAASDDERLAEMFSPILILTKETRNVYDDETVPIRVIKPESVSIVGAEYASYIWFEVYGYQSGFGEYYKGEAPIIDSEWFNDTDIEVNANRWDGANERDGSRLNFWENKFAFFKGSGPLVFEAFKDTDRMTKGEFYKIQAHFNYPGETAEEWNNTYFGTGEQVEHHPFFPLSYYEGENHPNTAYVHIYPTTHLNYSGTLTVIQYHYFYPYNHWWNNHEGDWQRIDVVVSSRDPDDNTIEVLGVEYRFHGAWVTYYKNFPTLAGITSSFDFNPQENVKLSQGTHPVVYVGAGSHAAYPVGGTIDLHDVSDGFIDRHSAGEGLGPDQEYMSHTGLVLSTLADGSHRDLWESYDLVLLPDYNTHNAPDPNDDNNMGLTPDMSWLGARIRWGTPQVNAPPGADNKSPDKGPYNSVVDCLSSETIPPGCGWGNLNFDEVGEIGIPGNRDPFHHEDLPYDSYHHWAIIGNETWSGTVTLSGDVVVFPGATLTPDRITTCLA